MNAKQFVPLSEAPSQELQNLGSQPPLGKGKIVLPGSEPPPTPVTYQSYPRQMLYEMAKNGDVQAGKELIRNPKGFNLPPNFKYMIEETSKKIPWRSYKK